jgi:hypothetical protein
LHHVFVYGVGYVPTFVRQTHDAHQKKCPSTRGLGLTAGGGALKTYSLLIGTVPAAESILASACDSNERHVSKCLGAWGISRRINEPADHINLKAATVDLD